MRSVAVFSKVKHSNLCYRLQQDFDVRSVSFELDKLDPIFRPDVVLVEVDNSNDVDAACNLASFCYSDAPLVLVAASPEVRPAQTRLRFDSFIEANATDDTLGVVVFHYAEFGRLRAENKELRQKIKELDANIPAPVDENVELMEAIEQTLGKMNVEEIEKLYLRAALKRNQGNRAQTARSLGVSEKTVYNKLKRYKELRFVARTFDF